MLSLSSVSLLSFSSPSECSSSPTQPSSSLTLTSAQSLTCTPFPATATFTTTYTATFLAACPTSAWPATYTIIEECVGNTFTPPAIPPNFVETTVVCGACATPTMTITCPVVEALQTGKVHIEGNGVTASELPAAAAAEATNMPAKGDMPAAAGSNDTYGSEPYAIAGAPSLKQSLALLGSVAALLAG